MSSERTKKSYENNTPENVIVTGGGSGIGEAICLRLASRQRHIYVVDIDLNQAKRGYWNYNTKSEMEKIIQ